MKRELTIIYDDTKPNRVMLGNPDGTADPWGNLGLLLEGVGVVTGACMNMGKTEHNGKPLDKYLKQYIDEVFNDYRTISLAPSPKPVDN